MSLAAPRRPVLLAASARSAPAHGMAALTIVMVLFFIMALVAAYANRNLIFEQRVAANSYRVERALMAADAGIDWAITMLNSGRVDMSCQPSAAAANASPRDRLLTRAGDGRYEPVQVANASLYNSCVNSGAQLTCVCPTAATPDPSPHAVKDWPLNAGGTAFRVHVIKVPNEQPRGAIGLEVQGCGSPGTGASSCAGTLPLPAVDGFSAARVFLGMVQALPHPPVATLTTGRDANAGATTLRVSNPDGATGFTVHAGQGVNIGGGQLVGPAGSSGDGKLDGDATLFNLRPQPADRFQAADAFFRATFGMDAPTYRRQPAVVRVTCGAGGCSSTELEAGLARWPGLTLWFDGDLRINAAPAGGTLGSATHPVMVIATGRITIDAAVDITGFLYATDVTWTGASATAVLRGALVAVEDFVADVPATLIYDGTAMRTIQHYYGSFVRVPGSWSRP